MPAMGTLRDITSQSQNTNRNSNASTMGYVSIASPTDKENRHRNNKSPHFMTPTFAFKQSTTPISNQSTRVATPRPTTPVPDKEPKSDHGSRFLKRVGLGRGNGTSRPKKVDAAKVHPSFSFPDKACLSRPLSYVSLTSPTACHSSLYKAVGSYSRLCLSPSYQGLSKRQALAGTANCTSRYQQPKEAQDHAHRRNRKTTTTLAHRNTRSSGRVADTRASTCSFSQLCSRRDA